MRGASPRFTRSSRRRRDRRASCTSATTSRANAKAPTNSPPRSKPPRVPRSGTLTQRHTTQARQGAHVHLKNEAIWMRSPCLGMCEQGPAALVTIAGKEPGEHLLGGVTLDHLTTLLKGGPVSSVALKAPVHQPVSDSATASSRRPRGSDEPRQLPRLGRLRRAREGLRDGPDAVIAEVTASKLMGRGGAAFPTGRKWDAVRTQPAKPHYLVCNADESEPGTFKDRVLMEHDPFALVEVDDDRRRSRPGASRASSTFAASIRWRRRAAAARDRSRRARAACSATNILGTRLLASTSRFAAAPAPTSAARRPRCSNRSRASAASRATSRRSRCRTASSASRRWSTTSRRWRTCRTILLEGGAAFAKIGTPAVDRHAAVLRERHVAGPGVYEAPFGIDAARR